MGLNKDVLLEVKDCIATVTLHRPEALNAFNGGLLDGLKEAAEQIQNDAEVRVVILTGAGDKAFCAGLDLKEAAAGLESMFGAFVGNYRNEFEANQYLRDVFYMYYQLPVPVIGAINGYCLGMGCELALTCDIRLAADTATFCMPELLIGTVPDCGGTQYLPRIVGAAKAKELIFTGCRIDAAEALRIGLVEYIYPKDKLLEEARRMAAQIATVSPAPIRGAKRAINVAGSYPLNIGLDFETSMAVMTRQDIGKGAGARLKGIKP